ncbi:hypothetical protein CDD80_6703 [Ophiocordyceps camponoti-rufipedis]|uniref:Uncharacterized protein n=1 Tax=Ophiocordyceps camponoti-rufipedis TaxID=2004952 RepID=A0A2C5YP22_9HYPO|nr:hypothetical protein CDD80_6703 [Ophiocordyceps camponoti-rufipedis]
MRSLYVVALALPLAAALPQFTSSSGHRPDPDVDSVEEENTLADIRWTGEADFTSGQGLRGLRGGFYEDDDVPHQGVDASKFATNMITDEDEDHDYDYDDEEMEDDGPYEEKYAFGEPTEISLNANLNVKGEFEYGPADEPVEYYNPAAQQPAQPASPAEQPTEYDSPAQQPAQQPSSPAEQPIQSPPLEESREPNPQAAEQDQEYTPEDVFSSSTTQQQAPVPTPSMEPPRQDDAARVMTTTTGTQTEPQVMDWDDAVEDWLSPPDAPLPRLR